MTAPQQAQAQNYHAEQLAAAVAVVAAAGSAASFAGYSLSNITVWARLIRMLYPLVLSQRVNAARSARDFFDRERRRMTGLPQLDVPLVGYDLVRFEKAMRPAYNMVVKQLAQARELEKQGLPVPKPKIEQTISLLASREVLAGGREEMILAVKTDNEAITQAAKPATKTEIRIGWGGSKTTVEVPVQDLDKPARELVGWARVANNETCAWCLMLVSRGPTYLGADTAGSKLSDNRALEAYDLGNLDEHMNEWHPGCDCTIEPVFKNGVWPSQSKRDEALELWNKARNAVMENPDKKYRVRVTDDKGKVTYKMETLMPGEARNREAQINLRWLLDGKDPNDRYIDKSGESEVADLLAKLDIAGAKLRKKLAAKQR